MASEEVEELDEDIGKFKVITKVLAFYRSVGFGGLFRVFSRALYSKLLQKIAALLRPFGLNLPSFACQILSFQSSDRVSLSFFEWWIPQLLNEKTPFVAIVPNYLGPGFNNLTSFVVPGSSFFTYRDADKNIEKANWIVLHKSMLGLIAQNIYPALAWFRVVFINEGFYLLQRNTTLPEVLSADKRQELFNKIKMLATSRDIGVIEKYGFQYMVRLKTMDATIIDEVRHEYFEWFWPEMKNFKTVIDLGSQIGSFATQITSFVQAGGKVYAFEPEPENFKLLIENVRLNQLDAKLKPYQAAVSDKDGQATLYVSSDNTGGNKLGVPEASSQSTVTVPTIDIVGFFDRECGSLDLLKIDVEGWELPILKRLRPRLKQIRFVIGELQRSEFGSPQDAIKILREEGFEVETKGGVDQLLFRARQKQSL